MEQLYNYQEQVIKREKLKKALKESARNENLSKMKRNFQKGKGILTKLNDEASRCKEENAKLETELQERRNHLADVNEKLYGGAITNSRELQDLQAKSLEEEAFIAVLEDEYDRALAKTKGITGKRQQVARRLKGIQADFQSLVGEIKEQQNEIKAQLKATEDEAKQLKENLPVDLLAIYEKEKKGLKNRVVVPLIRDNICSGCYCAITRVDADRLKGGTTGIRCSNCNRLLFLPTSND